jgi:hypothetical protein
MKILHSFWSKPTREFKDGSDEKVFGGWRKEKYMYMSWALSCLQAKKYYGEIELITDYEGAKLLVDKLRLPYTDVKTELDKLNSYPSRLWAVGKLYAYNIQNEPFIHIDNDVFIWDKFPERLHKADLLAQNLEYDIGQYMLGIKDMMRNRCVFPDVILDDIKNERWIKAANAGILGGNNLDFIRDFVKTSFKFIDDNLSKFGNAVAGSSHAIIYEQYLFSSMAREKGIEVNYYFTKEEADEIDLSEFYNIYTDKKYVHFIGDAKYHLECCRNLEQHLMIEYPEYYDHILSVV